MIVKTKSLYPGKNFIDMILVTPARYLVSDSLTENCSRKDWWWRAVIKQSAGPLPLSQNLLRVTKFQVLGLNFENLLLCPETILPLKVQGQLSAETRHLVIVRYLGKFFILWSSKNCLWLSMVFVSSKTSFIPLSHYLTEALSHWISEATVKP